MLSPRFALISILSLGLSAGACAIDVIDPSAEIGGELGGKADGARWAHPNDQVLHELGLENEVHIASDDFTVLRRRVAWSTAQDSCRALGLRLGNAGESQALLGDLRSVQPRYVHASTNGMTGADRLQALGQASVSSREMDPPDGVYFWTGEPGDNAGARYVVVNAGGGSTSSANGAARRNVMCLAAKRQRQSWPDGCDAEREEDHFSAARGVSRAETIDERICRGEEVHDEDWYFAQDRGELTATVNGEGVQLEVLSPFGLGVRAIEDATSSSDNRVTAQGPFYVRVFATNPGRDLDYTLKID